MLSCTKKTDAAARAARVILDGAGLLKSIPEIGRPMDDDTGRRELVIFVRGGVICSSLYVGQT